MSTARSGAIPPLRRALQGFETSIFSTATARATHYGAINLSQGFPDIDPPELLLEAAEAALRGGCNQYSPSSGLFELREAIAADLLARTGLAWDPGTEITVTVGATEAIWAICCALLEPGDEAVVIEPYYELYPPAVLAAGGVVRHVTTHFPDFEIQPDRLAEACTSHTRLIFVNTPWNPTGRVLSVGEIATVGQAAAEHGAVIVADEAYEHLTYGAARHVPVALVEECRERTITVGSASKTFNATGWRVGWAVAPPSLTQSLRRVHQYLTFAATSPLQRAVAWVLTDAAGSGYYDELRRAYTRRREMMLDALESSHLEVLPPEGTFFVLARSAGDDESWCDEVTRTGGVAALPASHFYHDRSHGRGLIRFAFCKRPEVLGRVRDRLAAVATCP